MRRRHALLRASAAAGAAASAATTLATPAVAQTAAALRWRMTSSFPRTLDLTYGAGEFFCRQVAALTDGRFTIQQFPAGEIVGGFQALDAVQQGSVEMAYTGALFYIGKGPAFALQIPPGDIYPALERGVIDAVEYIGPYDDEKLGLGAASASPRR